VTTPWAADDAPATPSLRGTVTLVEGSTFCISQSGGDILPGQPQGLFFQDTRVLSQWSLAVDGRPAESLTVQQADPYAAAFIGRTRGHHHPQHRGAVGDCDGHAHRRC
jgi:hypothetical protein